VDDGSTDQTWTLIQEYAKNDKRIVPIKNVINSQICISLNNGLAVAQGQYIVRIDADDTSPIDRIEKQVEFMNENPDIVISGGKIQICNHIMQPLNVRSYNLTDAAVRASLFRYSPFAHPAVIYRLDAVKKAGLYNPDLRDAEDYDLYFRLGRVGKFGNLEHVVHNLRLSDGSISQTRDRRQEKLTLYIRTKAVMEYGYHMTAKDALYLIAQFSSMYVVPYRFKFWLFNKLRS
jgi:glycosyltransferase involved in cell wall biosynthesis